MSINEKYLLKQIRPYVRDKRLTYDDFDKIFAFMERRDQYPIVEALNNLQIELVDEIDSPVEVKPPAEVAP